MKDSVWRTMDKPLLLIYLLLVAAGWFNIYSVVYDPENLAGFSFATRYGKQLVFIGCALLLAVFVMIADIRIFTQFAYLYYGVSLLLLVAVLVAGVEISGAKSWIRIGALSIQPSEFAKVATCLAFAKFVSQPSINMKQPRMQAMAAGWMGLDKWHGNSVAPVLVSRTQGMHKSTFCKMLLPDCLQAYYTDSVDLSAPGQTEQKLALFGLINLDEFDQITPRKMALLKNLMQMAELRIRKAYQKNFRPLPRIASFIATSNRKDLLSDPTGSRRFLCVELTHKIDASPIDHNQLYAQLKAELEAGERYWFTTEEELEIQRNNSAFYKQTAEEELFHTLFRPARKAEPCERLTSAEIFRRVKEKYPAAMLGMKLRNFTLMLANLGIPRLHLRYGNVYEVVPIEKIDDSQELADR